jgi:1,2-phenylacetyl-CoA epoxidase PaaB subunit
MIQLSYCQALIMSQQIFSSPKLVVSIWLLRNEEIVMSLR